VAQAIKQAMRELHGDLIRRMRAAERADFRRAIRIGGATMHRYLKGY
jgi:hypothetical protein